MIINDIATLRNYIPTIISSDEERGDQFSKYLTYLKSAEKFLKREIIGTALYDLLEEPNNDLIDHCAAVVAHKAYVEAIPFLDLIESGSGFAVTSNANLTPASTARVQSLIKATEVRLGECIEDLLEFLEENSEYHDDWKTSKSFSMISDSYIHSLREFRNYAQFENGRLEFVKHRSALLKARMLMIEPVISKELSSEIIEQLRDDDLNDANKVIIEDLRFALANYSIGADVIADSFIARVRAMIISKVDSYPSFKASAVYQYYLKVQPSNNDLSPFMSCGI
jgi:hypothetical protein